jgi:hypothetical protein
MELLEQKMKKNAKKRNGIKIPFDKLDETSPLF